MNTFVDRLVGSLAGEGVISALSYGFRLVTLPHGLLALALLQAVYPSLGSAGSTGDRERFRALIGRGLGTLTLALMPLAAGCLALGEPLVEVVYARGSFDTADVDLTARAVRAYAAVIVLLGWRELLARASSSISRRAGGAARDNARIRPAAVVDVHDRDRHAHGRRHPLRDLGRLARVQGRDEHVLERRPHPVHPTRVATGDHAEGTAHPQGPGDRRGHRRRDDPSGARPLDHQLHLLRDAQPPRAADRPHGASEQARQPPGLDLRRRHAAAGRYHRRLLTHHGAVPGTRVRPEVVAHHRKDVLALIDPVRTNEQALVRGVPDADRRSDDLSHHPASLPRESQRDMRRR